jgi:hypothetical protein
MQGKQSVLLAAAFLLVAAVPSALSASTPVFAVEEGLLTMQARNMPLREILQKIASQARVEIVVQGVVEQPVSADLSSILLEDGLRRITKEFNSVFLYGMKLPGQSRPPIQKVLLYAKEASNGRGGNVLPPVVFRPASQAAGDRQPSQHLPMSVQPPPPSQTQREELAVPEPEQPSLESIKKMMSNSDPAHREQAVGMLAGLEDGNGIALLAEILSNDKNENIKKIAAEALANTGNQRAVQALRQALSDNNTEVRAMAVYALGQIGGKEAAALISKMKTDPNEEVRQAATDALLMNAENAETNY